MTGTLRGIWRAVFALGNTVLMSIVCTFGVSLVIWIPVLMVMGLVTLFLFDTGWSVLGSLVKGDRSGARRSDVDAESPSARSVAPSSRALSQFVLKMRAQGVAEPEIRMRLQRAGWGEKEISRIG